MLNNRGMTVKDRLSEDIAYVESIKDREQKKILSAKALGAADLAVEFNLITYKEWNKLTHRIFLIL